MTKITKEGHSSKNWKAVLNIPHLHPIRITKEMIRKQYRIIDVRNNVGDAIRIKVDIKLKVIVNKLSGLL